MPGAHVQPSVGYGDGEGAAGQYRFGMGRHVVVSLKRVPVVAFPLFDQVTEDGVHVGLHVGVGIFVEGKSCAGVLDEQVQQSCARQGGEVARYFFRHQVETTPTWGQGEFRL